MYVCLHSSGLKPDSHTAFLEQIADRIRKRVDEYSEAFPTVLEIPSKDHPYDPEKDSVMKKVKKLAGDA